MWPNFQPTKLIRSVHLNKTLLSELCRIYLGACAVRFEWLALRMIWHGPPAVYRGRGTALDYILGVLRPGL